jgi:hypothetical protein
VQGMLLKLGMTEEERKAASVAALVGCLGRKQVSLLAEERFRGEHARLVLLQMECPARGDAFCL